LQSVFEPDTVADAAEAMRRGERVSAARLDRILEHEPGDLTAIVEAGLRLSELQAALAPHGQMLALDPPGDPTIGACLAGDLSGPRRHRYGAMRDLVIGVTVCSRAGWSRTRAARWSRTSPDMTSESSFRARVGAWG
jgi:FAD/FMN-containing dehydrogenase